MQISDFIKFELERVKQASDKAIGDLTPAELRWQPSPEGNPIGLLYFHVARSEDRFVQEFIQKKLRIWDSDKWYEKVGLPASDAGGMGFTIEQVAAFVPPDLKKMQDFAAAVRDKTNAYLNDMTDTKFDMKITMSMGPPPPPGAPPRPPMELSVGSVWTIILAHQRQHSGEISYLRGLQRGTNK